MRLPCRPCSDPDPLGGVPGPSFAENLSRPTKTKNYDFPGGLSLGSKCPVPYRPKGFRPSGADAGPGGYRNRSDSENSAGCATNQPRRPTAHLWAYCYFASSHLLCRPGPAQEGPSILWHTRAGLGRASFRTHRAGTLCHAIVLRGRKSAFRAGFWPGCYRESTEVGPPAGRGRPEVFSR